MAAEPRRLVRPAPIVPTHVSSPVRDVRGQRAAKLAHIPGWRRRVRRGESRPNPDQPWAAARGARTSISLDEPAIGFTIGLAHLAITAVIVATALQALSAAQLGLAMGAKISERLRERAEQVAGVALILPGGNLIAEQPVR